MKKLMIRRQTILLIALLIVGCVTEPEESNIIEREFLVIKSFDTSSPSSFTTNPENDSITTPEDNNSEGSCELFDCAGECGGNAVEQTYYYDNDGDGLGSDYNRDYCSANVPDNWVINSDDDDDAVAFCWILYTINILEEDLEETNGNISFTYNQEDYSIDVSSCIEIESEKVTRLIQDTELKVVYAFLENGMGSPFNYSSPNELLPIQILP